MLEIVDIIKPLLKKGQSVYQILDNQPELKMCSKTLYMYIESGIFQDYGINNFSLRRQVSMRKRKKLKKRKEPVNYEGRRYKDYLDFVEKILLFQQLKWIQYTINKTVHIFKHSYFKILD